MNTYVMLTFLLVMPICSALGADAVEMCEGPNLLEAQIRLSRNQGGGADQTSFSDDETLSSDDEISSTDEYRAYSKEELQSLIASKKSLVDACCLGCIGCIGCCCCAPVICGVLLYEKYGAPVKASIINALDQLSLVERQHQE